MASFGGETPINIVSVISTASPNYTYTVPTGRYAKISTVGAFNVGSTYIIYMNISGVQYTYNSAATQNIVIPINDLVLRAGDSVIIQTGGSAQKTLTAMEYNLP